MTTELTTERHGIAVTKVVDPTDSHGTRVEIHIRSTWSTPQSVRVRDTVPHESQVRVPSSHSERWTTTDSWVEYSDRIFPEESIKTRYHIECDPSADSSVVECAPTVEVEPINPKPASFTRGEGAAVSVFDGPGPGIDARKAADPTDDQAGNVQSDTDESDGDGNRSTIDEIAEPEEPMETDGTEGSNESTRETDDEFSMPEDELTVEDVISQSSSGHRSSDANSGAESPGMTTAGPAEERSNAESPDEAADPATGDRWTFDNETVAADERTPLYEIETRRDETKSDSGETASKSEATESVRGEGGSKPGVAKSERGPAPSAFTGRSLQIRVRHLESRFQEVEAYVDAMEEFIDQQEPTVEALSTLGEDVETLTERQAAVERAIDELRSALDETDERLSTLDSRQEALDSDVGEIEDSITDVVEQQTCIEDRLDELTDFQTKLRDAF